MNEKIGWNKISDKYNKSVWDMGNCVLYKLCEDHPKHTEENKGWILAKIWLIGRSYAASIERGRSKNGSTDDFFIKAAEAFIQFNNVKGFDKMLDELRNKKQEIDSPEPLNNILFIHKKLTDMIKKITGNNNRSFASKYLHFHCPIFPIFDSRANSAIGKKLKELQIQNEDIKLPNICDKEYAMFCIKIIQLYKHIKNEIRFTIQPMRWIDNYLLDSK